MDVTYFVAANSQGSAKDVYADERWNLKFPSIRQELGLHFQYGP